MHLLSQVQRNGWRHLAFLLPSTLGLQWHCFTRNITIFRFPLLQAQCNGVCNERLLRCTLQSYCSTNILLMRYHPLLHAQCRREEPRLLLIIFTFSGEIWYSNLEAVHSSVCHAGYRKLSNNFFASSNSGRLNILIERVRSLDWLQLWTKVERRNSRKTFSAATYLHLHSADSLNTGLGNYRALAMMYGKY